MEKEKKERKEIQVQDDADQTGEKGRGGKREGKNKRNSARDLLASPEKVARRGRGE